MQIIIDTDKKTILVPSDFKKLYDNNEKMNKKLGNDFSITSMINFNDYKLVAKSDKRVSDHTNKDTIDNYMDSIKDSEKAKYDEYKKLKTTIVKRNKKGEPVYTNFLTIKKWFYANFPEQRPTKK